MNIFAVMEYGLKHKDDFTSLAALIPKGSDPTLANDLVALINKHFPKYNPNGLIEDTLALIKAETNAASP